MKALGSRGGKGRVRSMLGINDSVAEDLRPKAKAVLEQMLDSEDESKRLAAARSHESEEAPGTSRRLSRRSRRAPASRLCDRGALPNRHVSEWVLLEVRHELGVELLRVVDLAELIAHLDLVEALARSRI
jgi:hypothetical protein